MGTGFRRAEDPRVVLPDVQRISPQEIPEAYLPYYFAQRPKQFLSDVQRLLTDSEWQDIDWFLTYHSNESGRRKDIWLSQQRSNRQGNGRAVHAA